MEHLRILIPKGFYDDKILFEDVLKYNLTGYIVEEVTPEPITDEEIKRGPLPQSFKRKIEIKLSLYIED